MSTLNTPVCYTWVRRNDGKDAVDTVFVIPAKAGIQSVFDSWYGARLSLE